MARLGRAFPARPLVQLATVPATVVRTSTQAGVCRIQVVPAATQPAVVRVQTSPSASQGGTCRIQVSGSAAQAAVVRTQVTPSATQSAVARVQATRTRTQAAKTRVAVSASATQSAVAHVSALGGRVATQAATVRITAPRTATQTAVQRTAVSRSATQTGVMRVQATSPLTNQWLTGDTATFEGGTTGGWHQGFAGSMANSTAVAHSGTHSLQGTLTAASYPECTSAHFPVPAGVPVTFSVWFYSTTALTGILCEAAWFNANGTQIGGTFSPAVNVPANTWTQLTTTATAPATTAAFELATYANATVPSGTVFYLDDASATTPGVFQTGVVRIAAPRSAIQTGVVRTAAARSATQTALQRTAVTRSATQPGVVRVAKAVAKTQAAVVRTAATRSATQAGLVRTSVASSKVQAAVVRIAEARSTTQAATQRTQLIRSATQAATQRTVAARTHTQAATVRVVAARTATQSANMRVRIFPSRTQTAIMRVASLRTAVQTAVMHIGPQPLLATFTSHPTGPGGDARLTITNPDGSTGKVLLVGRPAWTANDGGSVVVLCADGFSVLAGPVGPGVAVCTCTVFQHGGPISGTAIVTVTGTPGRYVATWSSGSISLIASAT